MIYFDGTNYFCEDNLRRQAMSTDADETVADLLASPEDFDPEVAAQRNYGFVRLQQLALAHLIS